MDWAEHTPQTAPFGPIAAPFSGPSQTGTGLVGIILVLPACMNVPPSPGVVPQSFTGQGNEAYPALMGGPE